MTITILIPVIFIAAYLIGILSGVWFSEAMEHNDNERKVGSLALAMLGCILMLVGFWYSA